VTMFKYLTVAVFAAATASTVLADPARNAIIEGYAAQAGAVLDAARGKALFMATQTGGKPDTPSCTTCHTDNPARSGLTRVGKVIEPMAVSANPSRFTDVETVEKWFGRNCNSVLGRDCTALEKGDVLTWLNNL
jgi:cytochrome c peroxidase